jgi:hypothetical protein
MDLSEHFHRVTGSLARGHITGLSEEISAFPHTQNPIQDPMAVADDITAQDEESLARVCTHCFTVLGFTFPEADPLKGSKWCLGT